MICLMPENALIQCWSALNAQSHLMRRYVPSIQCTLTNCTDWIHKDSADFVENILLAVPIKRFSRLSDASGTRAIILQRFCFDLRRKTLETTLECHSDQEITIQWGKKVMESRREKNLFMNFMNGNTIGNFDRWESVLRDCCFVLLNFT